MKNHRGLDLAGIIIVYICAGIVLLNAIVFFANYSFLTGLDVLVILIYITSLVLTILYHLNIIRNSILVGVLGIFTGIFIGGIFILVANNKKEEILLPNQNNSLESKLIQIQKLHEKGILSKEEYEDKRKDIISKFE